MERSNREASRTSEEAEDKHQKWARALVVHKGKQKDPVNGLESLV